jgi:hypothetical protein
MVQRWRQSCHTDSQVNNARSVVAVRRPLCSAKRPAMCCHVAGEACPYLSKSSTMLAMTEPMCVSSFGPRSSRGCAAYQDWRCAVTGGRQRAGTLTERGFIAVVLLIVNITSAFCTTARPGRCLGRAACTHECNWLQRTT